MWVPTSPLFDNMDDPPRRGRSVQKARTLQSQGSDEEYFVLPNSQDSNQEDDKTGSVKPSDDSSNDDSFDKTDATKSPDDSDDDLSENKMALGSPLHMSYMAGPSQHPQVQWQRMQVGHPLHITKGKEVKRTIKVSEKVRNIDTGRGAAKVHPDIWSQNR
ncbi:hypothetical protein EDB89DRAFT_1908338 [Lactarius sanguifluus]|nr:hypothetical protein EDB89DRAFT_1908338 [Lactarius sanguifluus]